MPHYEQEFRTREEIDEIMKGWHQPITPDEEKTLRRQLEHAILSPEDETRLKKAES